MNYEWAENKQFPASFSFSYKSEGEELNFKFVESDNFDSHAHSLNGRTYRQVKRETVRFTTFYFKIYYF